MNHTCLYGTTTQIPTMPLETEEDVVKSTCSISKTTGGALQIYVGGTYGFADTVLEGLPTSAVAKTRYRVKYYPRLKKLEITEL